MSNIIKDSTNTSTSDTALKVTKPTNNSNNNNRKTKHNLMENKYQI